MTTYRGDRTIDGVQVIVDDTPLDPALGVHVFTDNGFEWSYEGDGPRQLALAMLVHHLGDATAAKRHAESFMARIVANFGNEWEMTQEDIDRALVNIGAQ